MNFTRVLLSACVVFAGWTATGFAETQLAEINKKTITLLAGEAAWFDEGVRIANALAHEGGLKLLPMQGAGCISSTADLLQLTQVDVALLSSDCVAYAETQGLLPRAAQKLAYIARVKPLPLVIVTRKDIPNLTALAGKRIATGAAASASFAAGEMILGGMELPFIRVPKPGRDGLASLQRGEADAVLLVGLDDLDGSLNTDRFHVLGLPAPAAVKDAYAPALVDASLLKGLAGSETALETVSTSLVLAVFNWPAKSPKAAKLKLFADAYFDRVGESNAAPELSARVVGWKRHAASQKALDALAITSGDETKTLQQGDGP
jgi:TRAP-type uncharacterized transport system substrate-binding protein